MSGSRITQGRGIGPRARDRGCRGGRCLRDSWNVGKPREKEYITAGDWVKEYLPAHAVLFFIVPETSGASIKVLEDNEGS